MSEPIQLCELALKICDIVEALNEAPINQCEGAWTRELPNGWFLAANGHQEPVRIANTPERMGFTLQPFDFAMWKGGWLVASFNAIGVGILLVSEDWAIAALDAELERIKELAASP